MGLTLSRVHQVEAGELAAVLAKKKNADLQNQEIFIHARAHKQTEIIQVGGGVAPGLVLCCVFVFVCVCGDGVEDVLKRGALFDLVTVPLPGVSCAPERGSARHVDQRSGG